MTKRLSSKYKVDRRYGVNLWGRPKSPINKRKTVPGQHGRRGSKPTDYAVQFAAKQKLRLYYGNIGERQFRRYYKEAIRQRGDSGEMLVGLLEHRLDAVVYRAKFAVTVFAARQMVNHGHVCVNGRRVNIPSYRVRVGDVVSVAEKSRRMVVVEEAMALSERDVPAYIDVEPAAFKAAFMKTPKLDEIPYAAPMEPNLVIEFYSR